jgi:hypothetical protein
MRIMVGRILADNGSLGRKFSVTVVPERTNSLSEVEFTCIELKKEYIKLLGKQGFCVESEEGVFE